MSQSEPLLRLVSPAALTSYLPRSEWKDCLQIKFYGAFTFRVFVFGLLALCLITVWVNAAVAPRGEWTASEDAEVEWSRGIVVDAGSSGSRVYLYQWLRHSGNPDELLKIEQMRDENGDVLVKKQEPGVFNVCLLFICMSTRLSMFIVCLLVCPCLFICLLICPYLT